MQGIELAMLFCHAGFSVKSILLDGAEEQISSELLKEITGHAPWSNLHKPNWVKAEIKYSVGVIFDGKIPLNPPLTKGVEENTTEKDDNTYEIATAAINKRKKAPSVELSLGSSPNSLRFGGASKCGNDCIFEEYIKEHCGFIKILLNKEAALNLDSDNIKKQIILLPDNLLNLRRLFEKILSETVALTAAKALDGRITYSFEGDFSKIDYVKDLEKAFAEAGMEATTLHSQCNPISHRLLRNQPLQSALPTAFPLSGAASLADSSTASRGASRIIFSNGQKEIEIVLEADEAEIQPTKNRIYVSKHKNGLLLIDSIETRLLPDFSCQSCYSRLVNYIKVELTRLDY